MNRLRLILVNCRYELDYLAYIKRPRGAPRPDRSYARKRRTPRQQQSQALDSELQQSTETVATERPAAAAAPGAEAKHATADAIPPTYKRQYFGRRSVDTIKGVGFFGPHSEYVVSGSDDATIAVWDKHTGELIRSLRGHRSTVNTVVEHPFDPILLSSGIDNVVCGSDSTVIVLYD